MDDSCKPSSLHTSRWLCLLYACYVLIESTSSALLELSGKARRLCLHVCHDAAIGADFVVDSTQTSITKSVHCLHAYILAYASLGSIATYKVWRRAYVCFRWALTLALNSHVYERWTRSIIICIVVLEKHSCCTQRLPRKLITSLLFPHCDASDDKHRGNLN